MNGFAGVWAAKVRLLHAGPVEAGSALGLGHV